MGEKGTKLLKSVVLVEPAPKKFIVSTQRNKRGDEVYITNTVCN